MFKFFVIVCVLFVPIGALLFGTRGCDSVFPADRVYVETEDETFTRGKELVIAGREVEAVDLFGKIIRQHPNSSAESNFEVGMIAFKQGNYPLAIYHFNQYLALRPDAGKQTRERTIGLINSAKKSFLQEMLPGRIGELGSPGISFELEEKYRSVMAQNESLKREIATLQGRLKQMERPVNLSAPAETVPVRELIPVAAPVVETPEPEKPVVPATHTVAAGDTLSAISKKYYGTPARWRDIYNANRVTMDSPGALKIGMILKLPRP